MTSIIEGIQEQDPVAIRLASQFIGDNFQTPFGKIIRSKILNRLKNVAHLISRDCCQAILLAPAKFAGDSYKPQEYSKLIKLVEAIKKVQ